LGQGSFGTVWRAVRKSTGDVVAMKQLSKSTLPTRGVRRIDIEREIRIIGSSRHQNILRLYETFEDDESIYMALEYCDGGDFGDKVLERGPAIKESEVAHWVQQILSAISYLHSQGICHRDIKPDNFLVSQPATLKLADLGLAVTCPLGALMADRCGTPAFMAPEQLLLLKGQGKGYGLLVDVWAAGVTMYMVMYGGKHPWLSSRGKLSENRLLRGELDFRRSGFFGALGLSGEHMSPEARTVCQSMVEVDETRRLNADQLLETNWFAIADFEAQPQRDRSKSAVITDTLSRVQQKLEDTAGKVMPKKSGDGAQHDGKPRWEFETGIGFTPHVFECSEDLEEQYQAFQKGRGAAQGHICSMGREVVVDFEKMVQHVPGSHGIERAVRRRA